MTILILRFFLALLSLTTMLFAKQTLVRGNGAEPTTLDPVLVEGTPASHVIGDLFEPLMSNDPEGKVILGQAESYTLSKDRRVYTFKIRKDANWSNGDPVIAKDFEFAFRRGVDPKVAAKYSWYFKILGIKNAAEISKGKKPVSSLGVKALDQKTLRITLANPVPYFVIGLAHGTMSPVPEKVVRKYGQNWTKPGNLVCNGAYKLKTWVVNERIVLVKNTKYYAENKVQIDQVTYLPISGATVELGRYKAGEIDMLHELPKSQYKSFIKNSPREVKVFGQVATYYYELNSRKKPFNDVRVRKALSYAIDREVLVSKILGTGEKPAYLVVPEVVSGYTVILPEYAKWTQKQRNQKAKEFLNAAGFRSSHPLKFELLYNTNEQHKRNALAIASMWKKVFKGAVMVTLKNQEWKTYLTDKQLGHFDVARAGWAGDYNEASTMLDIFTKGHAANNSFYDNPKYDLLMNKARRVLDHQKRNKLYQQADAMLAEDMPIIPVFQYSMARLVKTRVGGYPRINPFDKIYTKYLYIKKKGE